MSDADTNAVTGSTESYEVFTDRPLPMRPEELTREWLGEALSQRFPGTEVLTMEPGRQINGTATKVQLKVTYNSAGTDHGLPSSLYVKGGFEWHEVSFKESFQAEASFYAEWAPRISANIPSSFYAARNNDQGIAIIEDLGLRNVTFSRATEPLDVNIVEQTMDLLAKIHAPWWNHERVFTLRTLGERVGNNFIAYMLEPTSYAKCLSEPCGATIPKAFHDTNRVLAGLKENWRLSSTGPQTFVHGDPHQGNMFFEPDGTPGYLDFQAYVHASSLHDVNYFIVGSMSVEERRQHEIDLIKYYLSRLAAYGVKDAWSLDEALERYRCHTMHGLMWFTTPPTMQEPDIVEATSLRFGTAAEDFKLAELLGV